MIRNESEYQEAVRRQREEHDRLEQHRARLAEPGGTGAHTRSAEVLSPSD